MGRPGHSWRSPANAGIIRNMRTLDDSVRLGLGAMTGTSLDGVDAALVRITGRGRDMQAAVLGHASGPLGGVAEPLAALCQGQALTAAEIVSARRALSDRVAAVMAEAAGEHTPDFAAVHGQTVLHTPPDSWQLIDAARVAHRLRCPTAFDLRGGDLAAGGQGAPVTPLADLVLFGGAQPLAIVNLGGFCNITWLPGGEGGDIRGRDICPCNHLLDAAARSTLGVRFDEGGCAAAGGRVDAALHAEISDLLRQCRESGRSLGSGDECVAWLAGPSASSTDPPTLLASLAAAIGQCIGHAAASEAPAGVLVAGGGAHHRPLFDAISAAAGVPTRPTSARGVPIEAREAAAVAVLAAIDADGQPTTLPEATGRPVGAVTSLSWCLPLQDSSVKGRA